MGLGFHIIYDLLEDNRTRIVAGRPWRLGNQAILVRTWQANFFVAAESKKIVTVIWTNIKNLPVEYHTLKVLIAIDNSIGKTVALDASN